MWMPHGHDIPGGHRIQMEKTAEALAEIGVLVRIETSTKPCLTEVELVHGFGLRASEVRYCRVNGLPVVLSTIYWSRKYRYGADTWWRSGRGAILAIGSATKYALARLQGRLPLLLAAERSLRSELDTLVSFEAADLLLPNAYGEEGAIIGDFGTTTPSRVIPNGVDPDIYTIGDALDNDRHGVLCVGRLEPHKNQLGLIEALRGTRTELVIVGPPHPHHPDYVDLCRERGAGWVTFHLLDADSEQLVRLYRSAQVHVLASKFETTGLVSLEAALCGCTIVSTSRGHASEYLGGDAVYCDPQDPRSIRQAVEQALRTPSSERLRTRILENFTWRHVAQATLAAYREVLDRCTDTPLKARGTARLVATGDG